MPRNLVVAALGDVVRINLSRLTEDDARAVEDAWRDAPAGPAVSDDAHVAPEVTPASSLSRTAMLADLSQRVTLAAIEQAKGRMWMLHAAGVALPDGRVVVLVGPSGRGKTTAARVLGAHYGYVSDETVAVLADGAILPYRKPLSVIEETGVPKAQRAPSDLALRPLPDAPLRLAALVLLDRRLDAPDSPVIESVDLGVGLTELVEQTSFLPSMAEPLRTVASHAASVGGIRRVVYREAESLVPVIPVLADVAKPGPPVPAATVARPPDAVVDGVLYARTPTVDAIDIDAERIALLHVDGAGHGTLRVLAGVAPAIWRTAGGVTLQQLTDAAVAAHGTPEGGAASVAVQQVVDDLVSAGVLERIEDPSREASGGTAAATRRR